MIKPLVFLTDCYGGRGGIAQYNRNLLESLSLMKEIKEITIFQRKVVYKKEKIPKKIKLLKNISNSKFKFLIKSIYYLFFGKIHNIIFCCHGKKEMVPVAFLGQTYRLANSFVLKY